MLKGIFITAAIGAATWGVGCAVAGGVQGVVGAGNIATQGLSNVGIAAGVAMEGSGHFLSSVGQGLHQLSIV